MGGCCSSSDWGSASSIRFGSRDDGRVKH
eukprot:COSAG04_NODE_13010_length_624_cov_0.729524_2_plen_28_part_01